MSKLFYIFVYASGEKNTKSFKGVAVNFKKHICTCICVEFYCYIYTHIYARACVIWEIEKSIVSSYGVVVIEIAPKR